MPKRFSRYNFALKAAGGSGAAGSALEKFKNYKTGATKPTYPREAGSNPGELKEIALRAFGAAADNLYIVQMSGRAQTAMPNIINAVNLFQHEAIVEGADYNKSFSPAAANIKTGGTAGAAIPSKLTGESYKPRTGAAGYTVPIGSANTGVYRLFSNVAEAIRSSVEAKNSKFSVSFRPESWKF